MAENHTTDLSAILASACADLRDRWTNYRDDFGASGEYASDVIHEIADPSVPVYTNELLELACRDVSLATDEPEVGPAFDGSPTPINIIAANVYERLTAALFEEFETLSKEWTVKLDAFVAQAEKDGYKVGVAAGSWVVDGNTTEESARRLLDGIDGGDPAVMDSLPSSPLSGEWADDLTPRSLLEGYEEGLSRVGDGTLDIVAAYEDGFARGVLDEVSRSASALVAMQECRDCGQEFPYASDADRCRACVEEMYPS